MCRCKHTSLVYVLLNFHLSIFWAFVNRIIFLISMFKWLLLVYKMQLIFVCLSYILWPCWTYLLVLGSFYFVTFYVDNHVSVSTLLFLHFVSLCLLFPFLALLHRLKLLSLGWISGEKGHFFPVLRRKHCTL